MRKRWPRRLLAVLALTALVVAFVFWSRAHEPAITAAKFDQVRAGMAREEVYRLLGEPSDRRAMHVINPGRWRAEDEADSWQVGYIAPDGISVRSGTAVVVFNVDGRVTRKASSLPLDPGPLGRVEAWFVRKWRRWVPE